MSAKAVATSGPPPRSVPFPEYPVMTTLPPASTATPLAVAPMAFTHTGVPDGVNFAKNIPPPESQPVPKLSQFPKFPVTTALPAVSTATPVPESVIDPPALFDQSAVPEAEYFVTKIAQANGLVTDPAPKSTVPKKEPVTTTLPAV